MCMKWPHFTQPSPNADYNFTSTPGDHRPVRLLILIGLGFMAALCWIYFQPGSAGYGWLYVLLTASVVFKLLRLLHEWYHYWNVRPIPPPAAPAERTYTVDVLTTYCPGEPHDMVINTLQAIQRITYPHTTYLCDEADDPYLRQVCADLGVRHVTRTDKTDAKAGNINNALQQATGEICLVIDPDHVPVPDFLDHVLPYFADPKVGFVQCVQGYYNQKESLVAFGATEQTYSFYGPMMTCMSQYGTTQAIGANCTFRRAALDSIGGHANGLSEDMHTAMKLHAKGWQSAYVPLPLSYGLVPGTMAAYYKQQLKWSRGTFELLVTTLPRIFGGLSWRQKLHYTTLPLYYLLGVVYLFDLLIPIGALLLMEMPIRVDLLVFCTAYIPLVLTGFIIRQYAQRWLIEKHEAGFHLVGGLLAAGTWWVYVLGFIYTVFRVKVPYIPTPKDDRPRNNTTLVLPNLLMLLATTFAMSYCIFHYWRFALRNEFVLLMLAFAGINAVVLGGNIVAGQESLLLKLFRWVDARSQQPSAISALRVRAWQVRYGLYGWLRRSALPLFAVMLVLACGLMAYTIVRKTSRLPETLRYANTQSFYFGTETPTQSLRKLVSPDEQRIVPQHLSWPVQPGLPITAPRLSGPDTELPLLYLEPTFGSGPANERAVQTFLEGILAGKYDAPLLRLATQVRTYPGPVLISLMPQFDDPARPWGMTHQFTLLRYRQAWQYVVSFMREHRAHDLCWLWCPAQSNTLVEHYPDEQYVDWLGLPAYDDPATAPDHNPHSFATLFQDMHYAIRMHKTYSIRQKPILITHFGTATPYPVSYDWNLEALSLIKSRYPQVRGVIF
jgi:cellulose synthase (UDP-forming)